MLYSGTLRFNLDPFSRHTDAELWQALESVQMAKVFAESLGGSGLATVIAEKGSSLSVGELFMSSFGVV